MNPPAPGHAPMPPSAWQQQAAWQGGTGNSITDGFS